MFDCEDSDCELTTECSPSCTAVAAVSCGSSVAGQSNGQGSAAQFSEYTCAEGFYTGKEIAYSFSVMEPTLVVASLANKTDQTDLMLVEGVDGACFSQNCIDYGVSDLLFLAQPDTDYYLVVDGLEGAVGNFDLNITCEACVSSCQAKICGDDGCGGSCGTCDDGSVCTPDGVACIEPPDNDTCDGATVIDQVPYTHTGSTLEAFDDYPAIGFGCVSASLNGGVDVAYSFTAPSSEVYQFTLSELDFDAVLSVTSSCDQPFAGCLGGSDEVDQELVEVGLLAGQTVFVLIDATDDLESGDYQLDITGTGVCVPDCDGKCAVDDGCGSECPCGDNDTCETAIAIDINSLPTTIVGTTAPATDDYKVLKGVCPGAPDFYTFADGAKDVVYSITPTATGPFTFAMPLGGSTEYDASLYIVEDCANVANTCIAGSEFIGIGGEAIALTLEEGKTYFVIVDGFKKGNDGVFGLEISQCVPNCGGGAKTCGSDGCGGSCGTCGEAEFCGDGDCLPSPTNATCDAAATLSSGDWVIGSTVGQSDDFALSKNACGGALVFNTGKDNGDLVWLITPTEAGVHTIKLDVVGEEWEPTVAVVATCSDAEGTCVEAGFAGAALTVSLLADTTYAIIIDGDFPGDDEGVFELSVCGECAAGEACIKGACVAPQDDCGGISFEGCCDGTVVKYCDQGSLEAISCAEACGWDGEEDYYDCASESSEDPSGNNPIDCPGQ